jgi:hypothetical protein
MFYSESNMLPALNPFDDFESTAQIEPLRYTEASVFPHIDRRQPSLRAGLINDFLDKRSLCFCVREGVLGVIASKLDLYGRISGNSLGMYKQIVAHKPLIALVPCALLDNVKLESAAVDRGGSP